MSHQSKQTFETILRKAGYKVTPGRVALLTVLAKSPLPLSIKRILALTKSKNLDQVSVYRALEDFALKGIVQKVDLQHAHAHYEFVAEHNHHHHVICKNCDTIEDIENCDTSAIEASALKKSKSFASIKSHSLEFFGICKKCQTR